MIKRLLFAAIVLCTGLCAARAQTFYESDSDIYGLDSQKKVKAVSHLVEIGFAKGLEAGYKLQRNFNPYLTWDAIGFKYVLEGDYVPYNYEGGWEYDIAHKIAIMTGLRAYTPRFGNWRGFAALHVGFQEDFYSGYCYDYWSGYYEDLRQAHVIGEFTIGLQYKKFHFGYGLTKPNDAYTFHLLRLGFTF